MKQELPDFELWAKSAPSQEFFVTMYRYLIGLDYSGLRSEEGRSDLPLTKEEEPRFAGKGVGEGVLNTPGVIP
jgi:hypothetical protein